MRTDNPILARISVTDMAISLGMAAVTIFVDWGASIPWTFKIPAALVAAWAALSVWRMLTLRRLLLPNKLQSAYENDLMYVDEVFQGRATIADVTFRRTELKGPGAIYLEGNCRVKGALFNPSLGALVIIPANRASLLPFYRFRNCIFDDCIFTAVGLLVDDSNHQLFSIPANEPELSFGLPKDLRRGEERPINPPSDEVSGSQSPPDTQEKKPQ